MTEMGTEEEIPFFFFSRAIKIVSLVLLAVHGYEFSLPSKIDNKQEVLNLAMHLGLETLLLSKHFTRVIN